MTRRSAVAGLSLALLLTGCGGGHPSATSTKASPKSGEGAAMLRLAQCLRAHGQPNFPDPVQNPDGTWTFPDTGQGKQKLPAACAALKNDIRDQQNTPSPASSADIAKLRQFAACLRRSGFPDWPDPDTNGAFALPSRLQGLGKGDLMNRLEPCKQYSPSRVHFKQPVPGGH